MASADTLGGGISDSQTILDVEIWDKYLAVLTEKNTVQVFNVARGSFGASEAESKSEEAVLRPIFKAQFKDATDQISQIFFVPDFMRERKESDPQSSEETSEEEEPAKQRLKGTFILMETKPTKTSEGKADVKHFFKKLHMA